MTSSDIEDFGTSWNRVKIHVGSMGFARWDHTGSRELYNGADRKERNKPVHSLLLVGYQMELTTEYIYALCASR
jgi:hypothetical protein